MGVVLSSEPVSFLKFFCGIDILLIRPVRSVTQHDIPSPSSWINTVSGDISLFEINWVKPAYGVSEIPVHSAISRWK